MPTVSVCIPTYNTARYLGAAIGSVLGQTFRDFELIVVDNASTDGTSELCRRIADPRVAYARYDEFVGQAANWNRCLDRATGEFVVLLHADDLLLPTFLERGVGALRQAGDVGLVHCAVQHIDADGAPLWVQARPPAAPVDRAGELLRRLLVGGCVVNPAGVMVRRGVYEAVGRFTEEIVWGVDWHMWARIAIDHPVAYLPETLACYRQHGGSGTAGVMAVGRNGRDEVWMMTDLFRRLPPGRPEAGLRREAMRGVAHRTWCFAEEMCRNGHMGAARRGITRAVAIWPGMLAESRVWALWGATYLGYAWFARLHRWRKRLARTRPAAD